MTFRPPIVSLEARFTMARKLSPEEVRALKLSPRRRYFEADGTIYWARDLGERVSIPSRGFVLSHPEETTQASSEPQII